MRTCLGSIGSSLAKRWLAPLLAGWCLFIAPAGAADHAPAAADLSPEAIQRRLRETVERLASPELEGRGAGTRGIELAAEDIAQRFAEAGLKTDHYTGKPFQEFAVSQSLGLGEPNRMEFRGPQGRTMALKIAENFTPLAVSRAGRFELSLAFAGYGITAPKLGYDDYAGLNVAGKAVIVLRKEPQQADPKSVFNGTQASEFAAFKHKVANAIQHGAAAIIFVNEQHSLASPPKTGKSPASAEADPLMAFQGVAGVGPQKIVVLHCRRSAIEPLAQAVRGKSLADLERTLDETLKPQSFELPGWGAIGEVTLRSQQRGLKNVIATIDGRGPQAGEAIVVGAHYDHLGRGQWGSLDSGGGIHPGADDNASGTAVLVEVARLLKARNLASSRGLIFVAFAGEELGLRGSAHYVRQPLTPISQTVAMLNLDMVGRLREDRLLVYGADSVAEFTPLLTRLGAQHGLQVASPWMAFGGSDHWSFSQLGVPALHLFTGLHPDYHRRSDTAEKLNYSGMQKIVSLSADVVAEWAQAKERPRPASGLVQGLLALTGAVLRERPTYLGVGFDPQRSGPGAAVKTVQPGSPAQRAGIRAGDLIRKLDGAAIDPPQQLAAEIYRRKPGQKVTLSLERGGKTIEVQVELAAPPPPM